MGTKELAGGGDEVRVTKSPTIKTNYRTVCNVACLIDHGDRDDVELSEVVVDWEDEDVEDDDAFMKG